MEGDFLRQSGRGGRKEGGWEGGDEGRDAWEHGGRRTRTLNLPSSLFVSNRKGSEEEAEALSKAAADKERDEEEEEEEEETPFLSFPSSSTSSPMCRDQCAALAASAAHADDPTKLGWAWADVRACP